MKKTISLAVTATLLLVLAGCTPEGLSGADPSDSSTPSETATSVESATPSPSATEEADEFDEFDYDNMAYAINTRDYAALDVYLADSVNFIIAASECCGVLSKTDAVAQLSYLDTATLPWTYPPPDGTLDSYHAGFYTDYFPIGALTLRSSDADPMVASLIVVDGKITGIFLSAAESLLLP